MHAKKLLDRIRVRPGGVGGDHGIEKLAEFFGGAHREGVDRMRDDVGVSVLGQVKANRKAARAGALRVVVGDARNTGEIREADRHRRRSPVDMRRPRQRAGFRRRRKDAGQQDALGMRRSEPGMHATVEFVEFFDDFVAQRQELFIGRQGHGSVLRVRDRLVASKRSPRRLILGGGKRRHGWSWRRPVTWWQRSAGFRHKAVVALRARFRRIRCFVRYSCISRLSKLNSRLDRKNSRLGGREFHCNLLK